jgi:hypothetical protein
MGKAHYIQTPPDAGRTSGRAKGYRSVKTNILRETANMRNAQKYIEFVHNKGQNGLPLYTLANMMREK